ncbi:peroxidase 29 [Dorcoceras hygrometricum]|uniref:Peroxidase n=1 Tax=Dorcoceras hygrometricum TaxID=472368 RepID=A0A2Z7BPV9_9LAMI|nr:peroxidase 29 [Dorcoceras hygrometricum]
MHKKNLKNLTLESLLPIVRNMQSRILALTIFLQILTFYAEGGGLLYNFYDKSCPEAENIIRAGLQSASLTDPTTPSAILRLMFHDCQVQGCDASILLDSVGDTIQQSELHSSKNFGIRKTELIGVIKSALEAVCPLQVSCADIIVLAAREAVAISGGPRIDVPLGRKDSSTPSTSKLADSSLPSADIGVDGMLQIFAQKGMTVEESVAILGGHTIGVTHCSSLHARLYDSHEGKEDALKPTFKNALKIICPPTSLVSNISIVQNDLTSLVFDSHYFSSTNNGQGLLRVDAEMPLDSRTRPFVRKFAADQGAFFRAFSSAFVKLAASGVLTGARGMVRRSCHVLN